MKVIIETERLIVREYFEDDAEAFFRLNSDPEVVRFVPDAGLANVEEARKILGLASEAAIASVRYGFADLGLKRVIGLVMPENTASVRVLEKAGLRYSDSVSLWDHQFSKYIIEA